MTNKYWDNAVYLISKSGEKLTVRSVTDAENFLLSDWHRFELKALRHAIMACLLSADDNSSIYKARRAFEKAAYVSGILFIGHIEKISNYEQS